MYICRFIHEPIDPMAPPMSKKERAKHPYKTIGCVFNHRTFYANTQVSVCALLEVLVTENLSQSTHTKPLDVCSSSTTAPSMPGFGHCKKPFTVHPSKTIGCIFNHHTFCANTQVLFCALWGFQSLEAFQARWKTCIMTMQISHGFDV